MPCSSQFPKAGTGVTKCASTPTATWFKCGDSQTGDLDEFSTIFRTMPVAFAYAEMSAAYERYVATEGETEDDEEIGANSNSRPSNGILSTLADELGDSGVHESNRVSAWDKARASANGRVLH